MKEALGKSKREEDENQKVKLAPEEVLAALPTMSKAEKKALKYSLLKEEEQIAWETYRHHRTELDEIGIDLTGRPSGASTSGPQSQMPINPTRARGESKDVQQAHAKYEAHKKEDLPRKVKEKKLEEFRWSLYQSQLDGSRLVPSTCSPVPTTTQARCNHYFYDLRWSANGDGHYARCKKCDLKHVIYFNERHGVLMAKKDEEDDSEVFLARAPGEAIADSGCRCAVAGEHWHMAMQKELKERGLGWFEEKEHETFRFGSGEPEISYKAMIYPVGIHGINDVVRISMVGGGAIDCPGLLGPSELARWKAVAKFAERQLELKGITRPMRMTATRHPAIDLLEYAKNTSEASFWKDEEIKNTVRVLQRCPQAWAFHTEAMDEDQESEAEDEEDTEAEEEVEALEEEEGTERQDHWRKWMKKLDDHLHELPLRDVVVDQAEDEEELLPADDTSSESESSHEFGVIIEDGDEDSDEDQEELEEHEELITEAERGKKVKPMNKGLRSKLGHHKEELQKAFLAAKKQGAEKELRREEEVSEDWSKKSRKFSVLELFTWTCMISIVAGEQGWTAYEPITLPRWDIKDSAQREEALLYLDRVQPDLRVVAWPCTVWSILQGINYPTAQDQEVLGQRRQQERPLLGFVREAVRRQRKRGGAVLGENPLTSRAWKEQAIQEAFEGLPHRRTDMCQFGLRRPDIGGFLKKPTLLAGNVEILQEACKICDHRHQHVPVLGGMWYKGKWWKVSEFAGGYSRSFAKAVLRGAEKFLKKPRTHWVFAEEGHGDFEVPEERFEQAEEEAPELGHSDLDDRSFEELMEAEMEKEEKEVRPPGGELMEEMKQRKIGQLELLHRRLGHPAPETLTRMLRMAGAEKWLVDQVQHLECPVCQEMQPPPRPKAQRSDLRPTTFNEVIHIDLKYMKDAGGKLHVALSMVDGATNFHQAVLLKTRDPRHVSIRFMDKWLSQYGLPMEIIMDQGGEWEAEFIVMLEQHGLLSKVCGAYAPWQNSLAERHGALLGYAWKALITEHAVRDRSGMKTTLLAAIQAKNSIITRRGYSANALVFGKQSNFPDVLDDEAHTSTTLGQALSIDSEVAKQAELRAAAKRALLHTDAQEKIKKALMRKPGTEIKEYLPGEKVHFWVPGAKKVRYRRDDGVWRGPAIIVAKESTSRYFISWRGRCLLVAATNLRPSSSEEAMDATQAFKELQQFEDEALSKREYEELEKAEETRPEEKRWTADETRIKRTRFGRTKREAQQLMKGLKSMKRVKKEPFLKRKYVKKSKVRKDRRRSVPIDSEASPSIAPLDEDIAEAEEPEEAVEVIRGEQQLQVAREEEEARRETEERRKRLTDDVPVCVKRRRYDEAGMEAEDLRNRFNPAVFVYVQNAVMEEEIAKRLADKTGRMVERPSHRDSEWMSRDEVKKLGELLELPLTAVRLHRGTRKRFQQPPKKRKRGRITVMLGESRQAMVSFEKPDEVSLHPRRRAGVKWRGLTLFTRTREKEQEGGEIGKKKAYIQVEEKTYSIDCPDPELWKAFVRREEEQQIAAECLLLKMKSSGKELDPKYFDEAEAAEFGKSDASEWQSWVDNEVLERLTPKEASQVPKGMIFKAPLRMVRTNKAKSNDPLKAKSRLVIPGHLDPELGGYRTDSPTTSPIAVRLAKSMCITKGWSAYVFDVSTAFLSGQKTQRTVFVKAPLEGLPAVNGMEKIKPHELLRVVKGAYGLAEAPRLWYLRAVELLEKAGMQELAFARSTFILKNEKQGVAAVCCMHVDDGLLIGDENSKEFKDLMSKVDGSFNIKEWKKVGREPVTYLGMDMSIEKGKVFIDDMTEYINKIQTAEISGIPNEALTPQHVTAFRRLVMQMRWPAQHVMPEYMFVVSDLAQRVTRATYEDWKKATQVLREMKESAKQGQARIQYRPIEGDPVFATYFDAALGKKSELKGQQGEIHFLTSSAASSRKTTANVVEYHSNKISRVVKSSMAAEGCSMTSAADKQLYGRLLLQALWYGDVTWESSWRKSLKVPGILVTDAKSLFDHCTKTGHMASERQTALDILQVKELIQGETIVLKWTPTFRQLADGLTKEMEQNLIREWKREGGICLVCTDEDLKIEAHRSAIRKAQRERRAARMKSQRSLSLM